MLPLLLAALCPFQPNPTVGFYQWASTRPAEILAETQAKLHALRSGLVRIYLGPRYDYHSPALAPNRQRLTPDQAWQQPHIRALLDDPCLATVVLTVYPARDYGAGADDIHLNRPWTKADEDAEYGQMLALANGLYDTYGAQGRTFILANSEADARLLDIANYTGSLDLAIANTVAWQRTRYSAIAEARRQHPRARMRLRNAFEISLVNLEIVPEGSTFRRDPNGTINALKAIVPKVPFDILSYSAYETINSPFETGAVNSPPADITKRLLRDWRILRRATTKPIMIGELGFSRRDFESLPTGGVSQRLTAALAAIKEVRPAYTVFWQAFDGPLPDGAPDGFGLLEPDTASLSVLEHFFASPARR